MGLSASLLNKKLKIIRRQGGEKIHLYGRVGQWPLKSNSRSTYFALASSYNSNISHR